MNVSIKLLNDNAIVPMYATDGSAGADIFAAQSAYVDVGHTVFISTGIALAIPAGYVGLIYARSGMACKRGLAPANCVGVLDSDFRGEIKVALHNHGSEPQSIQAGDRIAQLVIQPCSQVSFNVTDTLADTARGAGGFGSTGSR